MKWFKHDTDSLRNRKIRKVIRVHGATGYAVWFAVLENLYEREDGFQVEADELWLEDLADDLKISDYRTLIRVLDTFAEVGLISSQLWQGEHIVYCEAIAERGDNYIEKRAKEAEKKRVQRAKKSAPVPRVSPRDKKGTSGQIANVPPSDPDLDLRDQIVDLDPDPEVDLNPSLSSRSIAPREEKKREVDPLRDFEHPTARLEAWLTGRLPLCKTGRGPNDWDEESVQIILSWLKGCFGPDKTRADAIAYIAKRNHPDRDEYPALIARLEAGFAAKEKQAKAVDPIVAPAPPADPPPDAAWFEQMKQKALGAA